QSAERVSRVLQQPVGPHPTPHGPSLLSYSKRVAEFAQGSSAGLVRRHSALDVVARLHFDVFLDVALDLAVHTPAEPHDLPSWHAARRIPPTARASFSHFEISNVSCFRPARVRR